MSTFFLIQNHEVPVKVAEPSQSVNLIGDLGRSFAGRPLYSIQDIKHVWNCRTPLMLPTDARFMRALLEGRGHTFDFEGASDFLYSAKGLFPSGGTDANGARYTTTAKFGSSGIQVTASSYVQWNVGYDNEWTVMGWQGSNLSTAHHYIVTSTGKKWVDGVSNNAASTPFFDVVSGNFRLGDPAGTTANNRFDEVMIIDQVITDSWAADLGVQTTAWGPLPKLRVRGEFLQNNVYYAIGSEITSSFYPGTVDGVFYNDLVEVAFTLNEDIRVT